MVELHQIIEIAAAYVLQRIARVSRWVFSLLTCQALFDVFYNIAFDAGQVCRSCILANTFPTP